jgi:predicted amidophosphoribosyltransferase
MIDGSRRHVSARHECDHCGAGGTQAEASQEHATCSECGSVTSREDEFCPACGLEALILACADCGGPWRPAPPEAIAV